MTAATADRVSRSLLIGMLVISLVALAHLGWLEPVAIHYGPTGEPDLWTPAAIAALALPTLALTVWLLMINDRRRHGGQGPQAGARERPRIQVGVLSAVFVGHGLLMAAAVTDVDVARWTAITAGLLLALCGDALAGRDAASVSRIRLPGVRLEDEAVARVRRVARRVFMIAGTALFTAGLLLSGGRALGLIAAIVVIAVLVLPAVHTVLLAIGGHRRK